MATNLPTPSNMPAVRQRGAINVGLDIAVPSHDIKLTDVRNNTIGIVLTDRLGSRNPTMTEASMPRTALRTSTGNTGYSDMELPFVYEVQSDWSNGRGIDEFSKNRSAYNDGFRADTTKQQAICGPAATAQTGLAIDYINYSVDYLTGGSWFTSPPITPITDYFKITVPASSNIIGMEVRASVVYDNTTIRYGAITAKNNSTGEVTVGNSLVMSKTNGFKYIYLPFGEILDESTLAGSPYTATIKGVTDSYVDYEFALGSDQVVFWHKNNTTADNCDVYSWDSGTSTWIVTEEDVTLNCKLVTVADTEFKGKLFEYKRQLYLIQNKFNGNAPVLYMNGYRGAAQTNSTDLSTFVMQSGTTLTLNELAGAIVLLTAGPGSDEPQPWREIVSNTTGGICTVATPWKTELTSATEYVIKNTNTWTAVTSTGLTKDVTDVCVVNDIAIFCQGAAAKVFFMRETNVTGTWTREFDYHLANQRESTRPTSFNGELKADFMKAAQLPSGEPVVWRAIAATSELDYSFLHKAWDSEAASGQDLFFFDVNKVARDDLKLLWDRVKQDYLIEDAKTGDERDDGYVRELARLLLDAQYQITYTAAEAEAETGMIYTVSRAEKFLPYHIQCGSLESRITNLVMYGSPNLPYVLKEDSIGSVYNNIYSEIPLPELRWVRSEKNGRAAMQYGVYLYFSLEGGLIERYFDQRVDNVGPTSGEGLPRIRQGEISKILQYAGRFYCAVDAGTNGLSSVLCSNELGWHEIYRSDTVGQSIIDIYVEPIPGFNNPDRLWVATETTLLSMPIAINPLVQQGYAFYGYRGAEDARPAIISGTIDFDMKDIDKYFHSVTIFSDYPNGSVRTGQEYHIYVYYKIDDAQDWTLAGRTSAGAVSEVILDPEHRLAGRTIRLKIELQPYESQYLTPRLKAVVLAGVMRMPVKKSWTITFSTDPTEDLQERNVNDQQGVIMAWINYWANSTTYPYPLTMRSNDYALDNKTVFIDPPSVTTFEAIPERALRSKEKRYKHLASLTLYEV